MAEIATETKEKEKTEIEPETYREKRNLLLKDIEPEIIRKAWFTSSHLLIPDGSRVVDMGCDEGDFAYCLAAMNPKLKFTGLDKSKRQINKAKQKFKLPNLEFKIGDVSSELFEANSIDAIINTYVLHEVYSGSRYNERIVADTLRKHFKMLKKGGVMFIRDYARPPPEEFVLMEMPDETSAGDELAKLSEPDLLLWYAERARPRQDPGCGGFFLEELPERIPKTRLFKLPYKWAYEFVMRKDDRKSWDAALPMEYTFFTRREFRKELRALGARVQYSGSYWDEDIINEKFEGSFRLYDVTGQPLGHPPTCFIAVAIKMSERKSLNLEERRPSTSESGNLKISAMRNQKTGEIMDIVSRNLDVSEIIPYRIDEEERLKIYLHDGIPRSIANAVPRSGIHVDGRTWSGHMIEPVAVDGEAMSIMEEFDIKHSVKFARDYLGLKPFSGAILEHGPDYYPAPDYIDEKVKTFYLSVSEKKGNIEPKSFLGHSQKFQAKGAIREFDAQKVLDSITVGMLPNARLELQILSLFQHLKMKAETWSDKQLNLKISKINEKLNVRNLLEALGKRDDRFKDIKGTAGQIRSVHSVFVEEGNTRGSISGLTSQDVDFVVREDQSVNTVVVLPITKDLKGDVHAGINTKYLPIPQRHESNGLTISAPSFDLPPDITHQKQIKRFIADKFGIDIKMVIKMGESYYAHVGMTPQRIHPYAIAAPAQAFKDPTTKFIPFYQLALLQRFISKEPHFMTAIARAYRYFNDDIKFDAKLRAKAIVKQRFDNIQPSWGIPISYESVEVAKRNRSKLPEHDRKIPQKDAEKKQQKEVKAPEPFHAQEKAQKPEDKGTSAEAESKADLHKDNAPDIHASFEKEFDDFMQVLEQEIENNPKPEKW